jgi:hypothetical protein
MPVARVWFAARAAAVGELDTSGIRSRKIPGAVEFVDRLVPGHIGLTLRAACTHPGG